MYWAVFKELYLQRLETYRPGTMFNQNVRRVLDRFTAYRAYADAGFTEITQSDLEHYLARRRQDRWRGEPLSNVTLNNEIAILNSCFAYGGPKGHRQHEKHRLGLVYCPPQLGLLAEDELEPVELSPTQITDYLPATRYVMRSFLRKGAA
ncbi:hypothetical protein GC163_18445 [bacterium]|nr:hypothetical protein [bacterium]